MTATSTETSLSKLKRGSPLEGEGLNQAIELLSSGRATPRDFVRILFELDVSDRDKLFEPALAWFGNQGAARAKQVLEVGRAVGLWQKPEWKDYREEGQPHERTFSGRMTIVINEPNEYIASEQESSSRKNHLEDELSLRLVGELVGRCDVIGKALCTSQAAEGLQNVEIYVEVDKESKVRLNALLGKNPGAVMEHKDATATFESIKIDYLAEPIGNGWAVVGLLRAKEGDAIVYRTELQQARSKADGEQLAAEALVDFLSQFVKAKPKNNDAQQQLPKKKKLVVKNGDYRGALLTYLRREGLGELTINPTEIPNGDGTVSHAVKLTLGERVIGEATENQKKLAIQSAAKAALEELGALSNQ